MQIKCIIINPRRYIRNIRKQSCFWLRVLCVGRAEGTAGRVMVGAKRTAKNSVFLDLFQDKKNLLKLYKTLHPEDTDATEDTLDIVTIDNVLTDNLYNDLGIMVGNNRLLLLLEAQSSWTVNILIRILLYLAQSYHEYFERTSQSLYRTGD